MKTDPAAEPGPWQYRLQALSVVAPSRLHCTLVTTIELAKTSLIIRTNAASLRTLGDLHNGQLSIFYHTIFERNAPTPSQRTKEQAGGTAVMILSAQT
jgi:hypothetical protein